MKNLKLKKMRRMVVTDRELLILQVAASLSLAGKGPVDRVDELVWNVQDVLKSEGLDGS